MTDLVDEVPRDRTVGTSNLAGATATPGDETRARTTGERRHVVVVAPLAGAGIIHLVMVPVHWGGSTVDGVMFLVAGWVQLALAVLMVVRRTRVVLVAALVTSGACLGAWGREPDGGPPGRCPCGCLGNRWGSSTAWRPPSSS